MEKYPNPELIDDENPQGTAREMLKPRGGPRAAVVKDRITIRLSNDMTAAFHAKGTGWRTRMDAALKDWLRTHSPANT